MRRHAQVRVTGIEPVLAIHLFGASTSHSRFNQAAYIPIYRYSVEMHHGFTLFSRTKAMQ